MNKKIGKKVEKKVIAIFLVLNIIVSNIFSKPVFSNVSVEDGGLINEKAINEPIENIKMANNKENDIENGLYEENNLDEESKSDKEGYDTKEEIENDIDENNFEEEPENDIEENNFEEEPENDIEENNFEEEPENDIEEIVLNEETNNDFDTNIGNSISDEESKENVIDEKVVDNDENKKMVEDLNNEENESEVIEETTKGIDEIEFIEENSTDKKNIQIDESAENEEIVIATSSDIEDESALDENYDEDEMNNMISYEKEINIQISTESEIEIVISTESEISIVEDNLVEEDLLNNLQIASISEIEVLPATLSEAEFSIATNSIAQLLSDTGDEEPEPRIIPVLDDRTVSIDTIKTEIPAGKKLIMFQVDSYYSDVKIPEMLVEIGETITFPNIYESQIISDTARFACWEYAAYAIVPGESFVVPEGFFYDDKYAPSDRKFAIFNAIFDDDPRYVINFKTDNEYYDSEITSMKPLKYNEYSDPFPDLKVKGAKLLYWENEFTGIRIEPGDKILCDDDLINGVVNYEIDFTACFEDIDVKLNFVNVKPTEATGEIIGEVDSIEIPARDVSYIEKSCLELDGFKYSGWSLEKYGKPVIRSSGEIYPLDFINENDEEYTLYSVFVSVNNDEEENNKKNEGGDGDSGNSAPPVYGLDGEILHPGSNNLLNEKYIYELNPYTNQYVFYTYDNANNKMVVSNDVVKMKNNETGKIDTYITNKEGNAITGWVCYNGEFYYFSERLENKGVKLTGKINVNGEEYNLDENGKYVDSIYRFPKVFSTINDISLGGFDYNPAKNKFVYYRYDNFNNKKYITNELVKISNKITDHTDCYMIDEEGEIYKGWKKYNGAYYYFNDSLENIGMGVMLTGDTSINGNNYSFDASGKYVGDLSKTPFSNTKNLDEVIGFSDTMLGSAYRPRVQYYNTDGTQLLYTQVAEEEDCFDKKALVSIDYHPTPLSDKIFKYWSNLNSKNGEDVYYNSDLVVIQGVVKLYAIYDPVIYNVYYHGKNGSVCYVDTGNKLANYKIIDIKNKNISSLKVINKRYDLLGYSTTKGATTANSNYAPNKEIALNSDLHLYSVWQKKSLTYISEVKVAYNKNNSKAKSELTSRGYTLIDVDLNENAKGSWIYLGYKTTTDPNNAVTGMVAHRMETAFFKEESFDYHGAHYRGVTDKDGHVVDLNERAGGRFIYLYYTKDKSAGTPLMELNVRVNPKNVLDYMLEGEMIVKDAMYGDPEDFNKGAAGSYVYITYTKDQDDIEIDPTIPANKINSNNWMSKIPNEYYITEFNIPGTHDSGTALLEHALLERYGRCQSLFLEEQLNVGVRAFDCRFREHDGDLVFCHGEGAMCCFCYEKIYDIASIPFRKGELYITSALKTWINYLRQYPSETIIIRLRYEDGSQDGYQRKMREILDEYAQFGCLFLENRIPTLEEVRGKIVVMDGGWSNPERKLAELGHPRGIEWNNTALVDFYEEDNCSVFGKSPLPEVIEPFFEVLKKHFNVGNMATILLMNKVRFLEDYFGSVRSTLQGINKSTSEVREFHYINTNCFGPFPSLFQWVPKPESHADDVNAWFNNYNFTAGKYYGFINMDFINSERAKKIYMTNFTN